MANEIQISAEERSEFGKGAARRIRRENKVPAVLYGHGTDPVHITLPGHETLLALRTANALLALQLNGKEQLALPKQVQRDPVKGFLEHIDLIIVKRGEKVTVEVPLVLVGADAKEDVIITLDRQTLTLLVEATSIPESIEVDVTALEVGDQMTVGSIQLPAGAVYEGERSDLLVSTSAAPTQEELDADLATETEAEEGEESEGDEAAEGEGDGADGGESAEGASSDEASE